MGVAIDKCAILVQWEYKYRKKSRLRQCTLKGNGFHVHWDRTVCMYDMNIPSSMFGGRSS